MGKTYKPIEKRGSKLSKYLWRGIYYVLMFLPVLLVVGLNTYLLCTFHIDERPSGKVVSSLVLICGLAFLVPWVTYLDTKEWFSRFLNFCELGAGNDTHD